MAKKTKLNKREAALLEWLPRSSYATRQANHASEKLMHFHRGTMMRRGRCIVFGNDSFEGDLRSRLEVVKLLGTVEKLGLEVEGFGAEEGGYSWALVVKVSPDEWLAEEQEYVLNEAVWDAWFLACEAVSGNLIHPFRGRIGELLSQVA